MPIRLDNRSADFPARFAAFLATKREAAQDVEQAVRTIIDDVRKNGDRALVSLSRKFDRIDLEKLGLSADKITKRGMRIEQLDVEEPAKIGSDEAQLRLVQGR